jgi:hypothetical protein
VVKLKCKACHRRVREVYVDDVTGQLVEYDRNAWSALARAAEDPQGRQSAEARAIAEGRPIGGRGRSPSDVDRALGVIGPRRNWLPVGGDREHWQFPHKGCRHVPSPREDTLLRMVKDAIRRGESEIVLT